MAFRSSNPALSDRVFDAVETVDDPTQLMTVQGSIYKTSMLTGMLLLTACYTWYLFFSTLAASGPQAAQTAVMPWMIGGIVGGVIFALITIFAPKASPFTAPGYALTEGLALGGISAIFNLKYPGVVMSAVGLTFAVLMIMLGCYGTGLIKVTQKLRMGIVAATGAVALIYIGSLLLGLFGIQTPIINDATPLGIGFSVVVVIIAAFNLVLDFDFIEKGAAHGLPRYMEWYAGFGLLITLVWLYLEILRLLSKMRR